MLPLCAVVLTLVLCVQAAPLVRERRDMTKAELTVLYRRSVQTAEWMVRPKNGMPDSARSDITTHRGVTLDNGMQYLIHKGPDYGDEYDTVITDDPMSDRWKPKRGQSIRYIDGRRTVAEYIAAGGEVYRLVGGNCHDAARSMMRL